MRQKMKRQFLPLWQILPFPSMQKAVILFTADPSACCLFLHIPTLAPITLTDIF
jgi:hypothetical protein